MSKWVLRFRMMSLLSIAFVHGPALGAPLDPLDVWHWREPLPQGNTLEKVSFGNGIFVAVGLHGTILTSTEGINWTLRDSDTTESLAGINYVNGQFVVLGDYGSIRTSFDGVTWTRHSSGTSQRLTDVSYGNGRFVAVGWNATVVSSIDATNWTLRYLAIGRSLSGVSFGNGRFVAVGIDGTVLTSSNGVDWATQNSGVDQSLVDVIYERGMFIALGDQGKVLTSTDGTLWTTADQHGFARVNSLAYGRGLFVGVGDGGYTMTSSDAVSWRVRYAQQARLLGLAFGNDTFVGVGARGLILNSAEGVNWTPRSSGIPVDYYLNHYTAVASGQNMVVAADSYVDLSVSNILTSIDGVNWTRHMAPIFMRPVDLTYGNGRFVMVGDNRSLVSTDGARWDAAFLADLTARGVTYGAGLFVAVGQGSAVLTSTDGRAWTSQSLGTNHSLTGVAYGNGRFVAVGFFHSGWSSDGTNWIVQELSGEIDFATSVAFGNGLFVAVTDDGVVGSSTDGLNWTQRASASAQMTSITYGDGGFLAVGWDGTILSSADGTNWQRRPSGTGIILNDATAFNGTFVVVGDGILQSDPLSDMPPAIARAPISQSTPETYPASFNVIATGSSPLNYQWLKEGMAVTDAANSYLSFLHSQFTDAGQYAVIVRNAFGAVTSGVVSLTVEPLMAPTIIQPPASQTVDEFDLVSFSVVAGGTPPLYYQWLKDGVAIDGATETNLVVYTSDALTEGVYSVVVTNFIGSVTSPHAVLIVRPRPPGIYEEPASQIARPGGTAFFQVTAYSSFPLTYQWLKDGAPITDATNRIINLFDVRVADAGFYSVVVSARDVSSTSASARLIVETSDTLDHWEMRPVPMGAGNLNAVSYGNGLFVAVGDGGVILRSTNGHDWILQSVDPAISFKGISHGRGGFVAVGADEVSTQSVIYASADGVNWSAVTTILKSLLRAVTYGGGLWVAVGVDQQPYYSAGTVVTSLDGVHWTGQAAIGYEGLHAVTYAQGVFVATGGYGVLLTSKDGSRWILRHRTASDFDDIGFGAGSFVAVGEFGTVARSPDETNWRSLSTSTKEFLHGIAFGNGNFVTVGANGAILNSYDGAAWLARDSLLFEELRGVAYGNGTFVVVGEGGLIAQSDLLPRTPPVIIDHPSSLDLLAGWTASFGVTASGGDPLQYQWFKDGAPIDAATNAVLELFDVQPSDEGDYRVRVSNDLGTALSQTARLMIEPRVPPLGWQVRNPALAPNSLRAITHGKDVYVAVGDKGMIVTSVDGTNWTLRASGTTLPFQAVKYGNERFVAMGVFYGTFYSSDGAGSYIVTSPDGTNWTLQVYPNLFLDDLSFGNGLFVAVGRDGLIVTSEDGLNWIRRSTDVSTSLRRVAYGNSVFVALGYSDSVLTSSNGTEWTMQSSGVGAYVDGLTFGNGYFVAVAGYPSRIFTSTNGATWTPHTPNLSNSVLRLQFANGLFLAPAYSVVWSSSDATNWTQHPVEASGAIYDVTWRSGLFVGVGDAGTIVTSADLSAWAMQNPGPRTTLRSVTWGNGLHVAVGGEWWYSGLSNTNNILISSDGVLWTTVSVPGVTLHGVAFGNGTYVAVGHSVDPLSSKGVVLFSPDGLTWSSGEPGTDATLNGVTFAQGQFVAVGGRGTIVSSADGLTWRLHHQELNTYLNAVTYGNGQWVAVGAVSVFMGASAKILVSSNGVDWTGQAITTPPRGSVSLGGVAHGHGLFVAVGALVCFRFCPPLGELWTSPDGFNWTRNTPEDLPNLYEVTYGNNAFVAVGYGGAVATSVHGEQWTRQDFGTSLDLLGITAARGRFVAVGGGGLILQSDQVAPFSPPVARARVISPIAFLSSISNAVIISANGSNATVSLDGSLSSDPENDPLQFFWLADGNTAPFATGVFASALIAVGPHEFTLRVDDGSQSDTDTLNVEVVTGSQAVEALEQLVEQSPLPRREKRKLLKYLRDARAAFACASFRAGVKDLHRFLKKVRAKVAREHPALAAALTNAAQEIIDAVTPPGSRQPHITALQRQADGTVRIEFTGTDGPDYAVESSADLVHWRTLGLAVSRGPELFEFEDREPPPACQFYRVVER